MMQMFDFIIKHLWQQIYGKRSNFVIVSLQVLNFVSGLFIHMMTALLIPADMQRCLNSETGTFDLVAGEERRVFSCIPVVFISPLFGYLLFTSIRIFSVSMNTDRLLQREQSKTKALVFTNIQPTSSLLQNKPSLFPCSFH